MSQDTIQIYNLRLRCMIGFNEWERMTQQDVLINLTLYTDIREPGETDDPADALNYKTVTKAVIKHVEESSYNLVEALATSIARVVLALGAERVRVNVQKPGALRFTDSVGVEIVRGKADFE